MARMIPSLRRNGRPAMMSRSSAAALLGTIRSMAYRCRHCGNRTRFDVVDAVRRKRFHHYTLGGELEIETEEILERDIESIICRWCDRSDGIEEYTID
jgi:hypothetical protein